MLAILLYIAIYVYALSLPARASSAVAPPDETVVPVVRIVPTCATISAQRYNRVLRVRRRLGGRKHPHFASAPVCIRPNYRNVQSDVRRARRKCKADAITSGASYYGGASDASSGTMGAYGYLPGRMAFAELDMGHALGGLAPRSWWYLHHNRSTVHAQKLDIGLGGGPIDGVHRGVDLWWETLAPLGMSGNGVVQLSRFNCWV